MRVPAGFLLTSFALRSCRSRRGRLRPIGSVGPSTKSGSRLGAVSSDVFREISRSADAPRKELPLRVVERSGVNLPLRSVLRILRLSSTRYHSWKREEGCAFRDVDSCPRTYPHQLTSAEVRVVKEMVTSQEYRHVPTGTLALLAQRLGKVIASPATWYRLVRLHHWRRPRTRVHPSKPKVGIRASKPNQFWHIDTTVIRLLDGTIPW